MSRLHESLSEAASRSERKAITAQVINGIKDGDPSATADFHGLTRKILGQHTTDSLRGFAPETGEFYAGATVAMAADAIRLGRYLQAIDREPRPKTAIDAGCGASAILALGVAVLHNNSEIIGMDLNPDSVAIAQTLVEKCGMNDQITIQQADVLKVTLPQSDLGVTETFNAGLLFEPGHKITAALARSCRRILPSKAEIWGVDDDIELTTARYEGFDAFCPVGTLDLTQENDVFQGKIPARRQGLRLPTVCVSYLNTDGEPFITPNDSSDITDSIPLAGVHVPHLPATIHFQYKLGASAQDTPPVAWITK